MHVVYEHENGARLWMSGSKAAFDAHEYGVRVAFLLGSYQPEKLPGGVSVVHGPGLSDREDLTDVELRDARVTAHGLAAHVALKLLAGHNVLVQCDSGCNRSGLVCALAMRRLGVRAKEAVAQLRHRRSPDVLSNKVFLGIAMGDLSS